MPTVRKLAEIAGVSIATVSLALRDDPRLRPETRRRIQELAEQYQYRPNRLAQGVISGKSGLLGCVCRCIIDPFTVHVIRGMMAAAFAESLHLITLENSGNIANSLLAIHALIEHRVEGIILYSGHPESLPTRELLELRSRDIALLAVDYCPTQVPIHHILTDEYQLAHTIITYLMDLGHREIAYLGYPILPEWELHPRQRAVEDALPRHGLPTHHVVTSTDAASDYEPAVALARWQAKPHPPTAIITFNDVIAGMIMQEAARLGVRVPEKLSIIGCGNFEMDSLLHPPLTSIDQNPDEIGKQAVALLLQQIAGHLDPSDAPHLHHVPARLIERASCAPVRSR